jgi:predicted chitinase
MSMLLTAGDLARLAPRPKKAGEAQKNWDGYIAALTSVDGYQLFDTSGVNTRMELCAFLANMAEETGDAGGFTALWENLSFGSVGAIRRAWRQRASRYSDSWIQQNLLGKPIALGDWAYGGRMGNGVNNGDGYKYRGFGALQTTGKTDHLRYYNGDYSYLSSIRAALREWKDKKCDVHIANGDFRTACILINGGTNGLALREQFYAKAQNIWKEDPDWSVSDGPVVLDDSEDSATLGPSLIPEVVTAKDLQASSRKVGLIMQLRNWALGVGASGTGLSFADFSDKTSQLHQISEYFKENAFLLLIGGCVVGFIAAQVLINWVVDDHNSGRYVPSKVSED